MTPEEFERDFCTREWSRVKKDNSIGVIAWLMELRQLARNDVELQWARLLARESMAWEAEREELRARLDEFKDLRLQREQG